MTRTSKLKLLAAAAISAALLLLFLWFASEVYEGETLAFDNAVREWIHGFATPGLTSFFEAVTILGSSAGVVCVGAIAIIGFLIARDRAAAVVIAIIVVTEALLSTGIKEYYQRARPEPYFGYALPASYSFPSGHSFGSFCLYLTLAWLVTRRVGTSAAIATWLAAIILVLLIGLSRIYLGVHYPTDVIAGYVAAGMLSSLVLFGYHRYLQKRKAPPAGGA